MIHSVAEPELGEQAPGEATGLLPRCPPGEQGEGHIVTGVDRRDEVEELEHKADMATAIVVEFPLRGPAYVDSCNLKGSRVGSVQSADEVEQGGFAAAARPHHHNKFATLDLKIDLAQCLDHPVAPAENPGESGRRNQERRGSIHISKGTVAVPEVRVRVPSGQRDGRLVDRIPQRHGRGGSPAFGGGRVVRRRGRRRWFCSGSLAIVALSLSIPGFTLWLFGKRMGRASGMTSKLREAGIPGTATIVAVGDTGVTVNNDPVAAFTLDVAVDDGIPYRVHIRQLVSRVLMGAVLPGSRVGVVVDPVERELVTIDWSQAHEAPPSNPSGGGVPNLEGAKVGSAAELLSRGRRGTAVITAMQDMGDISDLNLAEPGSAGDDDRVFLVQLEVKLPGRQAYAATIGHRVPERFVGKVGPAPPSMSPWGATTTRRWRSIGMRSAVRDAAPRCPSLGRGRSPRSCGLHPDPAPGPFVPATDRFVGGMVDTRPGRDLADPACSGISILDGTSPSTTWTCWTPLSRPSIGFTLTVAGWSVTSAPGRMRTGEPMPPTTRLWCSAFPSRGGRGSGG